VIAAHHPRVDRAAETPARVGAPLTRGAAVIAARHPRVDRAAETHARVGAFLVRGAAVIEARRPRVDRTAETHARVATFLLVRETASKAATLHGATNVVLRIATLLPRRTTNKIRIVRQIKPALLMFCGTGGSKWRTFGWRTVDVIRFAVYTINTDLKNSFRSSRVDKAHTQALGIE